MLTGIAFRTIRDLELGLVFFELDLYFSKVKTASISFSLYIIELVIISKYLYFLY